MAKTDPFESHPDRYDAWFDDHPHVYRSELRAVRSLWPDVHPSLEIGVGTGRFAEPLGVDVGVDPSPEMRTRARARGLDVRPGRAEALPFDDAQFAAALIVTTICFVDRPADAFAEARRVLRSQGVLVVGMVDRDSPLGRRYQQNAAGSPFYRDASFHSVDAIIRQLRAAGFDEIEPRQTLFTDPEALTTSDPVEPGSGRGGFVVLRGVVP